MKVLVVEPLKPCYVREIEGLQTMQEIVGGHIEAIYPYEEPVAIIANEEAKLLGLPFNRPLLDEHGVPYDIVCGTFFVTGLGEETFVSLTDDQIRRYKELFDSRMVLTIPDKPQEEKLYFAYGMNVNLKKMARVCPDAHVVSPAVLEDHELIFRGNTAGNGLETIVRKAGGKVHGVLWRITQEGEDSLDTYEGYPNLYDKQQIMVHDLNGQEFSVMSYIMADDRFPQLARPSSYNYKVIFEGYQQNGLPVAELKRALWNCVQEARRQAAIQQVENLGFQTKRLCHNKQLINSHFYRGVSELPYKLLFAVIYTHLEFRYEMSHTITSHHVHHFHQTRIPDGTLLDYMVQYRKPLFPQFFLYPKKFLPENNPHHKEFHLRPYIQNNANQ